MEITCYRDPELAREPLFLPAATYNLALSLLSRSMTGCLFVPIRAMQYLAILDAEEFVFLDGEHKCWIDIAWQNFRPQQRSSLTEPVAYEAVYYNRNAKETMKRMLGEFPSALKTLAAKDSPSTTARIIKLDRNQPTS